MSKTTLNRRRLPLLTRLRICILMLSIKQLDLKSFTPKSCILKGSIQESRRIMASLTFLCSFWIQDGHEINTLYSETRIQARQNFKGDRYTTK